MNERETGQLGSEQAVLNERESLRNLSNKLLIHAGLYLTAWPTGMVLLDLFMRSKNFPPFATESTFDVVLIGAGAGLSGGILGTGKEIWNIRNARRSSDDKPKS